MMLGRFAAAAFLLAATMTDMCAAAEYRLLVLEGSWVKWGKPQWGAGATVTYAFASASMNSPAARNCSTLLPFDGLARRTRLSDHRLRDEAKAAFAAWAQISGLAFVETKQTGRADIVIGVQGNPTGRAFTNIELEATPLAQAPAMERGLTPAAEPLSPSKPHGLRAIRKSVICFNPLQKWKIGFDGDLDSYDVRYTLTHEIGHAIGLDHPGAAGALMGFRYDEKEKSLTKGDADAARKLYGAHTGK